MRRKYKLEKDGLRAYTQQMLKAYDEQIGKIKLQQVPLDNSIQMEDKSDVLRGQKKVSLFRNIVGSGIYLCQERYDVARTVKELASRMSNPTAMSFNHTKEVPRILEEDYGLVVELLQAGEGDVKKEKAIDAWKRSLIQTGVETKVTESQRQEDFAH